MGNGPQPFLPNGMSDKEVDRMNAYDEGRKFRLTYDISGETLPLVLKFEITKNIDLTLSVQNIYEGALVYKVFVGGVEGGAFTPITSYRTNAKTDAPIVDSGMVVSSGGTLDITGVDYVDISYIKTASQNQRNSTVTGESISDRGYPPTTAYVVIDNIPGDNNDPFGIVEYEWTVSK